MKALFHLLLNRVVPLLMLTVGQGLSAEEAATNVVATVAGKAISVAEYRSALNEERRQRFYHAVPPEGQLQVFQREVLGKLIDREVLLVEADRLGIQADSTAVEQAMQGHRRRYAGRVPADQESEFYAALQVSEQRANRVDQVEDRLRRLDDPTAEQVRAYYDANPEKFTQPARVRLSVILLKVEATADPEEWDAARGQAAELVGQIRSGADFAELARKYSGDVSASAGGDMGYLHAGQLGSTSETAISPLAIGEVADPLTVLEGVIVIKLVDRVQPTLMGFEAVAGRARDLWARDESDRIYESRLEALRQSSGIVVNESLLSELERQGR